VKISEFPTGLCSVTLVLRKNEKVRVRGKVIEKKSGKYLIVNQSPKQSFGPGTKVLWYRKEVKGK